MEIWEPKPPGTLWATPGLLRDSFTFTFIGFFTIINQLIQQPTRYVLQLVFGRQTDNISPWIINMLWNAWQASSPPNNISWVIKSRRMKRAGHASRLGVEANAYDFSITKPKGLRFFRTFSSVVRQMPEYNSQRRGTARTLPKNCCVVLCIVCFVSFCILFLCKCVLYYCHRVATQLQFNKYIKETIWKT